MKRQCWAQALGNCSDKSSNEHIVTKGLFTDGLVRVQGLPWCLEPKDIGLPNVTAKLLCSHHNNALSVVDSGAIAAKQTYDAALDLMLLRQQFKRRRWTTQRFAIDGRLLERWFLKTLINIAHCGSTGLPVGPDATPSGMPSDRLVEIAYGIKQFIEPEGLYNVSLIGKNNDIDDRVNVITLVRRGYVAGALFRFGSLDYHLHLDSDGPPRIQDFAPQLRAQLPNAAYTYHLKRSNFFVNQRISHSVHPRW